MSTPLIPAPDLQCLSHSPGSQLTAIFIELSSELSQNPILAPYLAYNSSMLHGVHSYSSVLLHDPWIIRSREASTPIPPSATTPHDPNSRRLLPAQAINRLLRTTSQLLLLSVDPRRRSSKTDEESEHRVEVAGDEVYWRRHRA